MARTYLVEKSRTLTLNTICWFSGLLNQAIVWSKVGIFCWGFLLVISFSMFPT